MIDRFLDTISMVYEFIFKISTLSGFMDISVFNDTQPILYYAQFVVCRFYQVISSLLDNN